MGSDISREDRERALAHMVGERLRWWRGTTGLTQDQIAERVGISIQQYRKYEAGKNRLSIPTGLLIAEAMNVSFGTLFDAVGTVDAQE
jgi:transcriptional regulator with XRE-family HTH domain